MIKYSIITPMFKSFKLMERYFDSLEHQTLKNFEVIIVDDCSPDDSYIRVKEYAAQSSLNISVYQTEKNSGPGNARNIGMDKAKGEWITFVDADDWVDYCLLEKIDKITNKYKVNCIIYDYCVPIKNKKIVFSSIYAEKEGIISLSKCVAYARNHTFGKFYQLSKCNNKKIRFPDLRRCEDIAFVARAIDACDSVYYLKDSLYYYYQHQSSLSNNKQMNEKDLLRAFAILEETLGDKYSEELKEKSVSDLLYGGVLMLCKTGRKSKIVKTYINNYESKYPYWIKYKIVKKMGVGKEIFLFFIKIRAIGILKMLFNVHSKLVG